LSDCVAYKIFDASEWNAAFESSDCIYIINEGILKRVIEYDENYNDYYKINSLESSTGVLIQGTNIEYSSINFYLVNVKNEGGTIVEVINSNDNNEFDLSSCISVVTFPDEDGNEVSNNVSNFIINGVVEETDNSNSNENDPDTME
jgi:hypothetical protein